MLVVLNPANDTAQVHPHRGRRCHLQLMHRRQLGSRCASANKGLRGTPRDAEKRAAGRLRRRDGPQYVQSATVCRFLTLDTLVLQTQACKPSPPPPSRVAATSHATTAFPTIAVASASKATAAFPAAASKAAAAAAVAVASKARVPSQSALRVPSECPLSAL
jgi:hypothetical protein